MTEIAMNYVGLDEAAHTLSALIQKVLNGEEVFITQNQKPIAKIVSVSASAAKLKKRIKAGSAKGLIQIANDFDEPLEDFREYMPQPGQACPAKALGRPGPESNRKKALSIRI